MSLLDALLLEPAPFEVWLAPRTDAQKGTGTQSDPYNASYIDYTAVSVTSLTFLTDPITRITTVTADTSPNVHGFSTGDMVTIFGVDRVQPADVFYVGTFAVTVTDIRHFTYIAIAEPGSTPAGALTGGIKCVREREQFDAVMRSILPNTTIHLGPGAFLTRGTHGAYAGGWEVKSGQKIYGAGIGVTTLKLVNAAFPEWMYIAITVRDYFNITDSAEVADLTIDCNISGQLHPQVATAAVHLQGRDLKVRRVRAINFGSYTRAYVENFVFFLSALHPNLTDAQPQYAASNGINMLFEDCIVEHFPPNPGVSNSFAFNFGGGERPNDGATTYHRGCAIRNCYINGDIVYSPLVLIQSITVEGSDTAVVTTRTPHQLGDKSNAMIRQVTVDNSFTVNNPFNGLFAVLQIVSSTVFKYKFTGAAPPANAVIAGGTVGGGVPAQPVAIETITPVAGLTYKITTVTPHWRTTNNNVGVSGVYVAGSLSKYFNGIFDKVTKRVSANELEYTLAQLPESGAHDYSQAFLGAGHIGLGADAGTAAIVEGNRVLNIATGGPYHDTFSSPDLTIRDNYYYNVNAGPAQNLGGVSSTSDPNALVSLDYDDSVEISDVLALDSVEYFDNRRAIATRDKPHGFVTNNQVTITGSGPEFPAYGGDKLISSVPIPKVFEYDLPIRVTTRVTGPGFHTIDPNVALNGIRAQRGLVSLTKEEQPPLGSDKWIATARSVFDGYFHHDLRVGEIVWISFAGDDKTIYPKSGWYNGPVKIIPLGSDPNLDPKRDFKFELPGNPESDSTSRPNHFAPGYFGRMWQIRRLLIENNVIELAERKLLPGASWNRAIAISIYGTTLRLVHPTTPAVTLSQRRFPQVLVRRNVIRHRDNGSDPNSNLGSQARGIEVWHAEDVVLENNLITVDRIYPIDLITCTRVAAFKNQTSAGTLLPLQNVDVGFYLDRETILLAQFEEATLLSLLI